MEKYIVLDRPTDDPAIEYWYNRGKYREKFKLSAAEMDAEPLHEYNMNLAIWRAEGLRQKKQDQKNAPSKLKNAR